MAQLCQVNERRGRITEGERQEKREEEDASTCNPAWAWIHDSPLPLASQPKTRAASTLPVSFSHHVLLHVHIELPSGQELPIHTHSNGSIRVGYTDVAQILLLYVNPSSNE